VEKKPSCLNNSKSYNRKYICLHSKWSHTFSLLQIVKHRWTIWNLSYIADLFTWLHFAVPAAAYCTVTDDAPESPLPDILVCNFRWTFLVLVLCSLLRKVASAHAFHLWRITEPNKNNYQTIEYFSWCCNKLSTE